MSLVLKVGAVVTFLVVGCSAVFATGLAPSTPTCGVCHVGLVDDEIAECCLEICKHKFHKKCVAMWHVAQWFVLDGKARCPLCSADIRENDLAWLGFNPKHPQILLYKAIQDDDPEAVMGCLLMEELDRNFIYQNGWTALHLAAIIRRSDIMNLLLQQEGVDATLTDDVGKTAFDHISTVPDLSEEIAPRSRWRYGLPLGAVAVVAAVAYGLARRR
jgi:hypothetical protein